MTVSSPEEDGLLLVTRVSEETVRKDAYCEQPKVN